MAITINLKRVLMMMILGGHSYSVLSFKRMHLPFCFRVQSISEYLGEENQ